MTPRRLALATVAALVLFHAREGVFLGRAYYERDLHLQWYGQVESFVRAIHAGSLPLWDPWTSFGQPMLANPNTQTLYPPTWLNLVMRPWTYYTAYLTGHLVLAGLGAFAAARRLSASPGGALVAAAAFVSSGPLLSLGNLWNHLAGAAFLPWTLYAALGLVTAPGARRAAALGATLAGAVLAGSPDFAVLNGLAAAAIVAARLAPWDAAARRRAGAAGLALAFALGLAAAQVLPSLELAGRSGRFAQSADERAYWSLHPASLVETVAPISGSDLRLSRAWATALHEGREPYLFSLFLGVPIVALAAGTLGRGLRRDAAALWAVAVGSILFALGRHLPVQALAVAALPPLGVVRFPVKAMVIAALALCLLAGLGCDRRLAAGHGALRAAAGVALALGVLAFGAAALLWAEPLPVARALFGEGGDATATQPLLAAVLLAGASAAASLALLARGPAGPAVLGLGLLAVVPAAWRHRDLNPTAPVELYGARPEVLEHVERSGSQRLFVYDYLVTPSRSRERLGRDVPHLVPGGARTTPWRAALAQRLYLLPPAGEAFGLLDSFGRDQLGIQPTPLARLNALALLADDGPALAGWLRLGAVGPVIALHELGPDLRLEATLPGPFLEDLRVYRVRDPLARVRLASGVRSLGTDGRMSPDEPAFDPAAEVLLEGVAYRPAEAGFDGHVATIEERPDRLELRVRANRDAWLVVTDTFDPGWRADVDGRPVAVRAANLAFRGLPVARGEHRVSLRYRPPAVVWGALLSAACAIAALSVVARRR